jgi:hypothetical protein
MHLFLTGHVAFLYCINLVAVLLGSCRYSVLVMHMFWKIMQRLVMQLFYYRRFKQLFCLDHTSALGKSCSSFVLVKQLFFTCHEAVLDEPCIAVLYWSCRSSGRSCSWSCRALFCSGRFIPLFCRRVKRLFNFFGHALQQFCVGHVAVLGESCSCPYTGHATVLVGPCGYSRRVKQLFWTGHVAFLYY